VQSTRRTTNRLAALLAGAFALTLVAPVAYAFDGPTTPTVPTTSPQQPPSCFLCDDLSLAASSGSTTSADGDADVTGDVAESHSDVNRSGRATHAQSETEWVGGASADSYPGYSESWASTRNVEWTHQSWDHGRRNEADLVWYTGPHNYGQVGGGNNHRDVNAYVDALAGRY
jgi:hypothetical protein